MPLPHQIVVWLTALAMSLSPPARIAHAASPHDEGLAAGQAANPLIRGKVTAPSASGLVPGYTTTPPERRITASPAFPAPPMRSSRPAVRCQATRSARRCSAPWPRPARRANRSRRTIPQYSTPDASSEIPPGNSGTLALTTAAARPATVRPTCSVLAATVSRPVTRTTPTSPAPCLSWRPRVRPGSISIRPL